MIFIRFFFFILSPSFLAGNSVSEVKANKPQILPISHVTTSGSFFLILRRENFSFFPLSLSVLFFLVKIFAQKNSKNFSKRSKKKNEEKLFSFFLFLVNITNSSSSFFLLVLYISSFQ